ncbi:SspB family protein [Brevundimonas balnearis]|uniref:SspB family protein n=1 Tax=Brevundimonas balnearis TaxID=1572858 RepID=A0ABV6QZG2_9CAUL
MAQERPPVDEMHYEALAQEALRGVIRAALERAAGPSGIPGAHHFYITFRTDAEGVQAPDDILEKYPEEMTIVLQHQYWDLDVRDDGFSVMLKFGGSPKTLNVPWVAVVRFYDPSVQFLLQFEPPPAAPRKPALAAPPPPAESVSDGEAPKVISLDQFRKK